jgi:hypothetical protein
MVDSVEELQGVCTTLKKLVLVALLFVASAIPARAQDPAPIEIGGVTFSGNIRERYEAWDFFTPTAGQNLYGFSGTQIRFGFSQTHAKFDWNIEFEAPILLGIPDGAVRPAPQGQLGLGGSYFAANDNNTNAAMIFPKQAFVRFKGVHSSLRVGRFEFTDGSEVKPKDPTLASLKADRIGQRLIGNFGYSDVMRSLDGVQYGYTNGPWNFTAVSAIPDRGVFQVDGWGWVKTPVTYVALNKQANFGSAHAEWRVFGIFYNDDRSILKTDNRSAPAKAADLNNGIDIGTYGGHIIVAAPTSSGTFDLLGWGVLQSGRWRVRDGSRLAAQLRCVGAAVASRRLLLFQWRQKPQRRHSRHIFRRAANAARLCSLSVFQLDEQHRRVRRSDAPSGQEARHPQRRARSLAVEQL